MARKKKLPEAEYRLRVFRVLNARTSKPEIALVVETTKEFVNFHYEVLIEDKKVGNTIIVRILGLHTPMSVMPGVGPARALRLYEYSSGMLTVIIQSPDGAENVFKLNMRPASLEVREAPARPFVLFSSQPVGIPES